LNCFSKIFIISFVVPAVTRLIDVTAIYIQL